MDCASASVIADGALCAITAGGSIEVVSKLSVSAIVLLHMSILLTLGQLALFTPGGCPKAKLELDDARPKTQLRDAKQFRPPPSTAIPLKFTCDSVACAATNPSSA